MKLKNINEKFIFFKVPQKLENIIFQKKYLGTNSLQLLIARR